MTELNRKYTEKTLKILFGLSGNQCAFPSCTNTLIESATSNSDSLVTAHICHIHAISPDGPRGNPGLTPKELNSPENLILLCRHHHGIVDGQHETYPATLLRKWKQDHEQEINKKRASDLGGIHHTHFYTNPCFPTALVDQEIEDEITLLRRSRYFAEVDSIGKSLSIGRRLVEGDLSGGTDQVRSHALSWCARLLSNSDELSAAEEYLSLAKGLDASDEAGIADAFIMSKKGDTGNALKILAGIDSPAARSAALMVVGRHEGASGALEWLEKTGRTAASLDSDGKLFLLTGQLEQGYLEAAKITADVLDDQDTDETPSLHHMIAMTHLLGTVPAEFQSLVFKQLPFDALNFPLASDDRSINARRTAKQQFVKAAEVASQINCQNAAALGDEYALWLELRDPENFKKGKRKLEAKLAETGLALRFVPLALQFKIKLDLSAVEQEIDRQIAVHGGTTPDISIARFYLAFTKGKHEDIANNISLHFDELSEYLDKKSMRLMQVELFAQAGLVDQSKKYFELLLEEGLSENEEKRLRRVILESEGADSIVVRETQFKQSELLGDLMSLVEELENRQEWGKLCEYGELLFERTQSVTDAERFARALHNAHRSQQLVDFVKANPEYSLQSENIQMLYSSSLYYEGALVEAQQEFEKLTEDRENPNYRNLEVSLGIAMGDWNALSVFVAKEYAERHRRSAYELMDAAQLALHLASPHAKELVFAATEKANDDAVILAGAYFLALSAGWEDEPTVSLWLHKAAELSGDDGPIQKVSMKDVLDRKPDWERRESDVWKSLCRAEIPLFIAAQSLNKSLVELMLFPAFANLSERDPRFRGIIPAYSGMRLSSPFDIADMKIGLDVTVLLTLGYLELLDKILDMFGTVYVPHSTLAWVFEEKQRATFHQPSRIRDAQLIRNLVATECLEKFIPSAIVDDDLLLQVGDELSMLIAEAEKARDDRKPQGFVVRSSPVHRISSLMEEEADLTRHAEVMSSCSAVVKKLREQGQITMEEASKAHAYLQLREKPWPDQPEIDNGAILYLDSLAISYLLDIGMLGKLKTAGFRPVISPNAFSEADALITYGGISDKVNSVMEHIRVSISTRIESGNISVGKQHHTNKPKEQPIIGHPAAGIISLAGNCDAILSDDRFLNQHACIDHDGTQATIFTTLDLLDALVSANKISNDHRLACRTLLRQAGYLFIPVSDDELIQHLNTSVVKNDKVVETAELKAIRENVLRVRMTDWLRLPGEAPWIDETMRVFAIALRNLWKGGSDLTEITARSNWLLEQVDIRGWAHSYGKEVGDNIVSTGRGAITIMLLAPFSDVSKEIEDAYWTWLEAQVLNPIKEQFPDLFAWLVKEYKMLIEKYADMELPK